MLMGTEKIKFRGVEVHLDNCSEETFLALLEGIIDAISQGVGFDSKKLEAVIFANDLEYGNCIAEYEGSKNYTHDEFFAGVGKTILKTDESGNSYVILLKGHLLKFLIDGVLKSVGDKGEKKTLPEKLAIYILAHELGHCLDYEKRNKLQKFSSGVSGFKIVRINMVNGSALLDELAACVNSGPYIDEEYFKDEMVSALVTIRDMYRKLADLKSKYDRSPESLSQIGNSLVYTIWRQLGYYAWWQGFRVSNPTIRNLVFDFREGTTSQEKKILLQFCDEIDDICKRYPAWDDSNCKTLEKYFHELALCSGYEFKITSGENDGLYWY